MPHSHDPAEVFHDHNHSACSGGVLERVDEIASTSGLRLTPVRRRVLEILLEEHRAMGAYEVLETLAREGFGNQPPVAYRALEFLVEHGLAHRIRRLNAFAACMRPGEHHAPAFFICSECDTVAESASPQVRSSIEAAAQEIGFAVDRLNVEVIGTCPSCKQGGQV